MPTHPIRAYCDRRKMLQQDFAQAVGVTPSVVSHYLSGEAKPSSRTALKIVEFTGGEITLGDLFTWEGA